MITTQEFQFEKLQLVEAEKKKLRQEYERKQKQVGINNKKCNISYPHWC
jgi:V-type H+-transporting ATPase subunit E